MIVFHAIIARKHGELNSYPVIAAFDNAGQVAVLEKYESIVGNSDEFARENAELLQFTIDGLAFQVVHHHSFEDPKAIAARKDRADLAEALRVRENASAAQATLDAAKDRLSAAKAALGNNLTAHHKKLLEAHDERVAADVARAEISKTDTAGAKASKAEQKRQQEALRVAREKALGIAIDSTGALGRVITTAPTDARHSLDDYTIAELKDIAAQEGVNLTGMSLKEDIIAAITLHRTPLPDRTIAQLQDLAEKEGIDLTGLSLKADIVSSIQSSRASSGPVL